MKSLKKIRSRKSQKNILYIGQRKVKRDK